MTLTTVQSNQTAFYWGSGSYVFEFAGSGGLPGTFRTLLLEAEIIRFTGSESAPANITTLVRFARQVNVRADLSNQSASVDPPGLSGLIDTIPTVGTYIYGWRVRWSYAVSPQTNIVMQRVRGFGQTTATTSTLIPFNLLVLGLKR